MEIKKEYTNAQKNACKRYYEKTKELRKEKYIENRDELKKKCLERYNLKYNTDDEFRNKKKEYMRQYQQRKKDEKML